eukprot:729302-Pelagomonas_calceolata.AAC.3
MVVDRGGSPHIVKEERIPRAEASCIPSTKRRNAGQELWPSLIKLQIAKDRFCASVLSTCRRTARDRTH